MILKILFLFLSFSFAQDRPTQIALNWKPEAEFGGIYAAPFKNHHLKVEIIPGGVGTPSVQMVAAGKIDFGIASADEIVIAQSHGAKIVAIFATYQKNTQAIMTHEENSFKTLADVFSSSNKIAMQKGLPYAVYLMKKFKGSRAQIVPYAGGISQFLTDKNFSQQCFMTSEPITAESKNQKVKNFLVADAGFNPYTTVVMTREDVLKDHPDIVRDLVAAIREGTEIYLKDPEKTNVLMNGLNPSVDLETLRLSAAVQKPFVEAPGGLGKMITSRWSELVDQLADLKLIDRKPAVDQLFKNM